MRQKLTHSVAREREMNLSKVTDRYDAPETGVHTSSGARRDSASRCESQLDVGFASLEGLA
jgi:hypothetical protein